MKFVALLSGGKDSCYNVVKCQEYGHELVCVANLLPPTDEQEEMHSFMYQSAAHGAIPAQAECLGVPLIRRRISGEAVCQTLHYESSGRDEVEDLHELLAEVLMRFPDVSAVSCGAILSTYQRLRVEDVCARLGLTLLAYLWQRERAGLLDEMVDRGVVAVLVKVAGAGLQPERHLGRDLAALRPALQLLHQRFGLDLCGEGGEYETLTLDCPCFGRRLVIDDSRVELDDEDPTVGNLRVLACHSEDKPSTPSPPPPPPFPGFACMKIALENAERAARVYPDSCEELAAEHASPLSGASAAQAFFPPSPPPVHFSLGKDGLAQSSLALPLSLHAPSDDPEAWAAAARVQVAEVLGRLEEGLVERSGSAGLRDALYVHLYLADMALFAAANEEYCRHFSRDPPSRSCVQIPLPFGVLVAADCLALVDSHTYAAGREGLSEPSRRLTLHVRAVSEWAPTCIGPYAQANVAAGQLVLVAGQIPLNPGTMTVHPPGLSLAAAGPADLLSALTVQLSLSFQHAQSVLATVQSGLSRALQVTVYVNLGPRGCALLAGRLALVARRAAVLLRDQWSGLHAGAEGGSGDTDSDIDSDSDDDCGSEDDGSGKGDKKAGRGVGRASCPVLVLGVTGLPRDCLVEVEVCAATYSVRASALSSQQWDCVGGGGEQQQEEEEGGCLEAELQAWPLWNSRCALGLPPLPTAAPSPPAPPAQSWGPVLSVPCRMALLFKARSLCAGVCEASLPSAASSSHTSSLSHTADALLAAVAAALKAARLTHHTLRCCRVLVPSSLLQACGVGGAEGCAGPSVQATLTALDAALEGAARRHLGGAAVVLLRCEAAATEAVAEGEPVDGARLLAHFLAADLLQMRTEAWVDPKP